MSGHSYTCTDHHAILNKSINVKSDDVAPDEILLMDTRCGVSLEWVSLIFLKKWPEFYLTIHSYSGSKPSRALDTASYAVFPSSTKLTALTEFSITHLSPPSPVQQEACSPPGGKPDKAAFCLSNKSPQNLSGLSKEVLSCFHEVSCRCRHLFRVPSPIFSVSFPLWAFPPQH